jgi:hypothetical protein
MGTTVPYLTVAELQRSPISTQLQKLVPGFSDADRDAELARIIMSVSALINGECGQNLAATVDNEVGTMTVSDDGALRIHCRSNPIIDVQSISVGRDSYSLTSVSDLSKVVLDPWRITLPRAANPFSRPGQRLWVEWTYVNGYPVTTLASAASPGDTSITVADATGVLAGQTLLTVNDGKWLETIVPTAVAGNTLTVPALAFAHQVGTGVSALPQDVKEATRLLISRLHNSWSLSMGAVTHDGTGARKNPRDPSTGARALCDAGVMLAPYKRVW